MIDRRFSSADLPALLSEGRRRFFAKDRSGAASCFEQVLHINKEHPDALHFLGVIAYLEHRPDQAVRLLRRAAPRLASDTQFFSNLGLALQAAGDFEAAVTAFRRAVALGPQFAVNHAYLGVALRDSGALTESAAATEAALARSPELALARFNRAVLTLLRGDCVNPWLDHEWRVAADDAGDYARDPRTGSLLPRPSGWRDEDLSASRLLVLHEQGIGDEMFYLRYAATVRSRCAGLDYLATAKTAALLESAPGVDRVFTTIPSDAGTYQRVLMVGDLPLLTRPGTAGPPPALRFVPEQNRLAKLSTRLHAVGPPPYLAVTWRAGPAPVPGRRPGRRRHVPIDELAPALVRWPGTLVSVQRHAPAAELERLALLSRRPVVDCDDLNESLPDMLAALSLTDSYVGVGNANTHIYGGLGKPAHVLVTVPPDWLWTEAEGVSPWFPDFKLLRADRKAGWRPALEALAVSIPG